MAVQQMGSQSRIPDQELGPNTSVQWWASFERTAIDVAEPFPRSDQRNRYLLIAIDYFTKWLQAWVIFNQESVAEALFTNFHNRFGVPRALHSDQACNFESRLIQVLHRLAVIIKTRTTPCTRSRTAW
jgi:hypothetical protein